MKQGNVREVRWGDRYIPQNPNFSHWGSGSLGILRAFCKKSPKAALLLQWEAGCCSRTKVNSIHAWSWNSSWVCRVIPPILINAQSLTAVSQYWLLEKHQMLMMIVSLPTTEVLAANLYRNEIIAAEELPIYHCLILLFPPWKLVAIRRDTRGLIHTIHLTKLNWWNLSPSTSEQEHQQLVQMKQSYKRYSCLVNYYALVVWVF